MQWNANVHDRIIFVVRPDLLTNPGGDTVQITETKRHLEILGVSIDILYANNIINDEILSVLPNARLVHFFNLLLARQFHNIVAECSIRNIPTVLSPIYWEMEEYERRSKSIRKWKKIIPHIGVIFPFASVESFFERHFKSTTYNQYFKYYLQRTLRSFDLVLPNSEEELNILHKVFSTLPTSMIVYNGCRYLYNSYTQNRKMDFGGEYILCVGRVEFRKNQLQLIRAMEGLSYSLVLVGNINLAERRYWLQCIAAARNGGVKLFRLDAVPWEQLGVFYQKAICHVQPSWYETPGLSSLEAAAYGCPIVCTSKGSAYEYFYNEAQYCDPDKVQSIRESILYILGNTRRDSLALRDRIRRKFTWQYAAKRTMLAYQSLGQFCKPKYEPTHAE